MLTCTLHVCHLASWPHWLLIHTRIHAVWTFSGHTCLSDGPDWDLRIRASSSRERAVPFGKPDSERHPNPDRPSAAPGIHASGGTTRPNAQCARSTCLRHACAGCSPSRVQSNLGAVAILATLRSTRSWTCRLSCLCPPTHFRRQLGVEALAATLRWTRSLTRLSAVVNLPLLRLHCP